MKPVLLSPWLATLAGMALAMPSMLSAQTANAARWSSSASASSQHTTRRNESASPFRFTGRGNGVGMTLERLAPNNYFGASLVATHTQLHSIATESGEEFTAGELNLAGAYTITAHRLFRLDAGLDFRTSVDVIHHSFTVSGVPPTTYRFSVMSLGPLLRVKSEAKWGRTQLQLSVPGVALVDHPYSAVKSASSSYHPALASVNKLRRVDVGAAYTTMNRQRLHARVSFSASAFALRDDEPVRAVSNTLSLGLVLQQRAVRR